MNSDTMRQCAELAAQLARECDWTPLALGHLVKTLYTLGRRYSRLMERACNEPVDEWHEKRVKRLEERIASELPAGVRLQVNSDPRGATVKLVFPSGACNDRGCEGRSVPGS